MKSHDDHTCILTIITLDDFDNKSIITFLMNKSIITLDDRLVKKKKKVTLALYLY